MTTEGTEPEGPSSGELEPRTHTVQLGGVAAGKGTTTGELSVYEAAAESARDRKREAEVSWKAQLTVVLSALGALLVASTKALALEPSRGVPAGILLAIFVGALIWVLPKVLQEARRSRQLEERAVQARLSPGVRSLGERLARQRRSLERLARTSDRGRARHGR